MHSRFPRLWNWVSLTGGVTVAASVFAAGLLFLVDSFGQGSNPYVGILTYLVAPVFTFLGLGLIVAFLVAWAVIAVFLAYVKRHSLGVFAYYRIALGIVVLLVVR